MRKPDTGYRSSRRCRPGGRRNFTRLSVPSVAPARRRRRRARPRGDEPHSAPPQLHRMCSGRNPHRRQVLGTGWRYEPTSSPGGVAVLVPRRPSRCAEAAGRRWSCPVAAIILRPSTRSCYCRLRAHASACAICVGEKPSGLPVYLISPAWRAQTLPLGCPRPARPTSPLWRVPIAFAQFEMARPALNVLRLTAGDGQTQEFRQE